MRLFEATPKQWGNSLGITIPSDIVRAEQISQKNKIRVLVIGSRMNLLKEMFGSLKLKKPTQRIMDEIDEGYD